MEGKLGGQALVLDVEGTWRELTAVVNKLAANLTNQVCYTDSYYLDGLLQFDWELGMEVF